MISRQLHRPIEETLLRGKSVLLFGARQTGKTTLVKNLSTVSIDLSLSLALPETRYKYEKDPSLFVKELEHLYRQLGRKSLVFVDEIQKTPKLTDGIQYLIDEGRAQFILTGSSARKIRQSSEVNLLPGRVVVFNMDPLSIAEFPESAQDIEALLSFGSLPAIMLEASAEIREIDLRSYGQTYLSEEIEAEAAVRNIGKFANFLELSASESGGIINFSKLAQELGVSRVTAEGYYKILEDCLIAYRIPSYSQSKVRKRLTKSCRYLYFDLGVRRMCAKEGLPLSREQLGRCFEQFVGLELIKYQHISHAFEALYFWRDHNGVEVDYVLEKQGELIPIEVKYTSRPSDKAVKHIRTFIKEYSLATRAYVVCNCDKPFLLDESITALPWQQLGDILT